MLLCEVKPLLHSMEHLITAPRGAATMFQAVEIWRNVENIWQGTWRLHWRLQAPRPLCSKELFIRTHRARKKKTDLPPYCAQSVVGQDVSDVRFEFRLQISLPVPRVGSRSLGLNRWGRITELWKSIWKSMCQPARFCQLFWYSSGFRGLAVSQPLLQSPQVLCKIFPA